MKRKRKLKMITKLNNFMNESNGYLTGVIRKNGTVLAEDGTIHNLPVRGTDREGYKEVLIDAKSIGGRGSFSRQSVKPYIGMTVRFYRNGGKEFNGYNFEIIPDKPVTESVRGAMKPKSEEEIKIQLNKLKPTERLTMIKRLDARKLYTDSEFDSLMEEVQKEYEKKKSKVIKGMEELAEEFGTEMEVYEDDEEFQIEVKYTDLERYFIRIKPTKDKFEVGYNRVTPDTNVWDDAVLEDTVNDCISQIYSWISNFADMIVNESVRDMMKPKSKEDIKKLMDKYISVYPKLGTFDPGSFGLTIDTKQSTPTVGDLILVDKSNNHWHMMLSDWNGKQQIRFNAHAPNFLVFKREILRFNSFKELEDYLISIGYKNDKTI